LRQHGADVPFRNTTPAFTFFIDSIRFSCLFSTDLYLTLLYCRDTLTNEWRMPVPHLPPPISNKSFEEIHDD